MDTTQSFLPRSACGDRLSWRGVGAVAALLLLLATPARALDWPQFRGPNGDGATSESIQFDWPAAGPRLLWKHTLTNGFSSIAVTQGRVVTQVLQTVTGGKREVAVAYDSETGTMLWNRPLLPVKDPLYDGGGDNGAPGNGGGDGPRSTPAIVGSRVLILTSWQSLYCLDLVSGDILWSKDLVALYGARGITWQSAASPVVENDLVIVNCNAPGKTFVALRIADGSLGWQSSTADKMTQSTPVVADLLGTRQLVYYAQSGLVGLDPASGAVLWRQSATYNGTSVAASPVVATNLIYASAGYGTGARVARIAKTGATFTSTQIARTSGANENHWATPVHHQGYVYGLYGSTGQGDYYYGQTPLKCLKLDTLEEQWSVEGFGPGGIVLVNNKLLVLTQAGELVLVDPNPTAYTELRRFKAVGGKCWNVPAVSNGRLYVRSTKEIAAFDVSLAPPPALRLEPPRVASDGTVQLRLTNADGSPADAGRAARIAVYASPDAPRASTNWSRLPAAVTPVDAGFRIEDPAGGQPQRFYRAQEDP
ncbi:MAG TPA: PQQ-binding-like beta-propeller repeat protein [Verrucomicrobiota bacterium]|nr:PQQ-binding-like beta-propeller repeat protein [Verrucomicrobiota bacterium]